MSSLAYLRYTFLTVFFTFCLLAACSPQYDWRTVKNPEMGYGALFPGRPTQVTRMVNLTGWQVPLTMQATQTNGLYFAVATVPLQGELQARQIAVRDALYQALVNNLVAEKVDLKSIQWLGKTADEAVLIGRLPDGQAAVAQVRFFEHHRVLYQILILGPEHLNNRELPNTWWSGFYLLRRE